MSTPEKSRRKASPEAATHHERYPQRLHAHLEAAAEASQAISEPLPVEADPGTPDELVSRYGANESPEGGSEHE